MKATCPECGFKLKIDDAKVPDSGAKVKCPKCQAKIVLKKPDPDSGAATQEGAVCPKCGAPRKQGETECPECGVDLAYIEREKAAQEAQQQEKAKRLEKLPEWQKCPKCNAEKRPGDKMCHECGIDYEKYTAYMAKRKDEIEPGTKEKAEIFRAKEESIKKKAEKEAREKKEKEIESTLLKAMGISDQKFKAELAGASTSIEFISFKQGSGSADMPLIKGSGVDYTYIVDEETFTEGDPIVRQGKHGSWLWVVLDGVVEIRKATPKGLVPMLRVGNGSFVGSIAPLSGQSDVRRSASVAAIGSVELGVIDAQRILREYNSMSPVFRNLMLALDKRLKQTTDKAVAVYSNAEPPLKELTQGKQMFIKQGDGNKNIYEIESGNAMVVRKTDHGHVLLAELEKGDITGRIPFISTGQEPDFASVVTSKDFRTKTLDAEGLRKEFDKISTIFKHIVKNTSIFILATTLMACEQKKRRKEHGDK